jgi:hypothetical protein
LDFEGFFTWRSEWSGVFFNTVDTAKTQRVQVFCKAFLHLCGFWCLNACGDVVVARGNEAVAWGGFETAQKANRRENAPMRE